MALVSEKQALQIRVWRRRLSLFRHIFLLLLILLLVGFHLIRFRTSSSPVKDSSCPPHHRLNEALILADDPLLARNNYPTVNPDIYHQVNGSHAMVASDVPLCLTMGKNVLLDGGNAADAAVTVALCIGVINSHSSGIGGGGYIVSKLGDKYISINARESAPQAAHKSMYDENYLLSKVGGLAVAVPGELKGLSTLYHTHGSGNLTWARLIQPVIELCDRGFQVTPVLHDALVSQLTQIFSRVPQLLYDWDFIFKNNRELVEVGDWIRRPLLGKTLRLIANNGSSDIFYDPEGPIAPHLVSQIKKFGGIMEVDDFSAYAVEVEEPLKKAYLFKDGKKYTVYSSNGNSGGLVLQGGLNLFEKLYDENDDVDLHSHKIVELMKWMASIRSHLGDFLLNSTARAMKQRLIDEYTSDEWANNVIQLREYRDNSTFPWKHYKPAYEVVEDKGTSHFTVVDADGNAVGMTTTVNLYFGSSVYDPVTGIILNDEMDDFLVPGEPNAFNLTPSIYNFISPGKRPLSSTSPTIIVDGETDQVKMLIGAAGGSRITTAVFQAIVRVLYEEKSLLLAISYPRFHHQLIPEMFMVENFTVWREELVQTLGTCSGSLKVIDALGDRGHVFYQSGSLTAMNGIIWDEADGKYHGVSDFWRKMGRADGY